VEYSVRYSVGNFVWNSIKKYKYEK